VLGAFGCEVLCVGWCWVSGTVCCLRLGVRYIVLGGVGCDILYVGWG